MYLSQLAQIFNDQLGRFKKRQQVAISTDQFQLHHLDLIVDGVDEMPSEAGLFQAMADDRIAFHGRQSGHLTTTVADDNGKEALNSGSPELPYCTGNPLAAAKCRAWGAKSISRIDSAGPVMEWDRAAPLRTARAEDRVSDRDLSPLEPGPEEAQYRAARLHL